jgi:hypothetical protein
MEEDGRYPVPEQEPFKPPAFVSKVDADEQPKLGAKPQHANASLKQASSTSSLPSASPRSVGSAIRSTRSPRPRTSRPPTRTGSGPARASGTSPAGCSSSSWTACSRTAALMRPTSLAAEYGVGHPEHAVVLRGVPFVREKKCSSQNILFLEHVNAFIINL